MTFIQEQSSSFRDIESAYSICLTHRIPIILAENQEKCLDKMMELVMNMNQPINLNIPIYINQSNIQSDFEQMLRVCFTPEKMNILKDDVINTLTGDFQNPWSFFGLTKYWELYSSEIMKNCDAMERKFWDMFVTGKNALTNKELKELEKHE